MAACTFKIIAAVHIENFIGSGNFLMSSLPFNHEWRDIHHNRRP